MKKSSKDTENFQSKIPQGSDHSLRTDRDKELLKSHENDPQPTGKWQEPCTGVPRRGNQVDLEGIDKESRRGRESGVQLKPHKDLQPRRRTLRGHPAPGPHPQLLGAGFGTATWEDDSQDPAAALCTHPESFPAGVGTWFQMPLKGPPSSSLSHGRLPVAMRSSLAVEGGAVQILVFPVKYTLCVRRPQENVCVSNLYSRKSTLETARMPSATEQTCGTRMLFGCENMWATVSAATHKVA